MGEFKVNAEMFGKYVIIPTGYSKEPHIYKVINSLYSNSYCDVPIVYGSEPVPHESVETTKNPYGLEECLNVIHCGIDETKVVRVALKDCKIVQPKTNADRIRGMSDEELAEFIYSQVQAKCSARDCVGAETCYYHADWNGECGDGCERAILRWLQSEVEE